MKQFLIMSFLFISWILPANAQLPNMQIDGKPQLLDENFEERRDVNGRFCAVIKIVSDLNGFSYDSYNGIVGDVINNPGVDFIYLSPDERVFLIFHEGYEPLKIILSEIDIQLKEKQMWLLNIKAGIYKLIPVSFMISPKNAQMMIDNKAVTVNSNIQLHQGKHPVKIFNDGYLTLKDTIFVDLNSTLFTYNLIFEPEMIFVKGGTYKMGDASGEGEEDEKPIHEVELRSFYIGKYEVNQAQWRQVMGSSPSYFKGDSLPAEKVNWYDAIEFCNRLSRSSGLTPCYTIIKTRSDPNNYNERDKIKWSIEWDFSADGYRLPTEAEWEYACRGGTQSENYKFSGSNNMVEVAWSDMSFTDDWRTHPVGTKKANELGIYDMSGNVCEWCWDWYAPDYYRKSPSLNPCGPSIGIQRVARGGTWSANKKKYSRCANRIPAAQFKRNEWDGLRLCKSK